MDNAPRDAASFMMGSGSPLLWGVFAIAVTVALCVDLGVFRKNDHPISVKRALAWTSVWILLAAAFCGWLWSQTTRETAVLFASGYVIEYALSVDNLFVFIVVFSYFKVAPELQRRVLFWGILSAAVLRGILIFAGAALIARFHWVLYLFGAFLLYTSFTLLFARGDDDDEVDPGKNPVLRLLRRAIPIAEDYDGRKFFTVRDGRMLATPLLAVLAVVETTDVFFAFDSVPAIFSISTDTFVVYTSNIFAILGLRSLFFALAAMMGRFRFLDTGIAMVLAFVAAKMLLAAWIEVPVGISLLVIAGILGASVGLSSLFPEAEKAQPVKEK